MLQCRLGRFIKRIIQAKRIFKANFVRPSVGTTEPSRSAEKNMNCRDIRVVLYK